MALCQFVTRALAPRTNNHLTTTIPQVLRMCVALGTVTENRNFFVLEELQISIGVIKNLGGHYFYFPIYFLM